MPDGIALVEWYNEHWYKVTENEVGYYIPSVTTKLGVVDKPNLARWRGDIGNREADLRMHEAGDRGKRIHWAWEVALKGGAVVFDPWQKQLHTPEAMAEIRKKFTNVAILRTQDEMWQVLKLQKQFDILKPTVLAAEVRVYDIGSQDAGTIDSVYQIEAGSYAVAGAKPLALPGGIYINDLKTGSYVDENVWLQLAPYAVMYEKMNHCKVAGALVTHSGATVKGGVPGLKTLYRDRQTLMEKDYPDYRRASDLWLRNHADDKPSEYTFPAIITLGG